MKRAKRKNINKQAENVQKNNKQKTKIHIFYTKNNNKSNTNKDNK